MSLVERCYVVCDHSGCRYIPADNQGLALKVFGSGFACFWPAPRDHASVWVTLLTDEIKERLDSCSSEYEKVLLLKCFPSAVTYIREGIDFEEQDYHNKKSA